LKGNSRFPIKTTCSKFHARSDSGQFPKFAICQLLLLHIFASSWNNTDTTQRKIFKLNILVSSGILSRKVNLVFNLTSTSGILLKGLYTLIIIYRDILLKWVTLYRKPRPTFSVQILPINFCLINNVKNIAKGEKSKMKILYGVCALHSG
jgi:hypothetical protein